MTFNQINYFLAVAKHLNFTRAATSLFITQSTLSKSISALETELGTTLVERDFHNVRLTQAGELMAKEMRIEMDNINDIINRVQLANKGGSRRFIIGLLDGQRVYPSIIHGMRMLVDTSQDNGVEVRIERKSHQDLLNDLLVGKLDVVQMSVPLEQELPIELDSTEMCRLGMVLVAKDDHPIWEKEPINIRTLADQTLIVPEARNWEMESNLEIIRNHGVWPKLKRVPDTETLTFMLDAGMGTLLCNEFHIVYTSMKSRAWKAAYFNELPKSKILLIWRKDDDNNIVGQFLQELGAAPRGFPLEWAPGEVDPNSRTD